MHIDLGMQVLYLVRCNKLGIGSLSKDFYQALRKQSEVFHYFNEKGVDAESVMLELNRQNVYVGEIS